MSGYIQRKAEEEEDDARAIEALAPSAAIEAAASLDMGQPCAGLEEPRQGIHEDGTEELKTWDQLWEENQLAAAEIRRLTSALSVSQRWIPVSERNPNDEQTVLACWTGPSVFNEGMESLTYHAADAPDGHECWRDVFGELRDPPTHWTLKDLPK